MADLSSSGWIRVAADSILQLTQVSLAGYELLLTQSHNWLEFRWLDTSYSWLLPTANSSSGSWVRLKTDSILRLTMSCGWLEFRQLGTSYSWLHPTADWSSSSWIRLKADSILRLTISCDWLDFLRLDTSYSWFHPGADYELRVILSCGWLESAGLTRLASDLYFNISSKFKDIFFKIYHFYGLFSITWFQLPLIQAQAAVSRTLKKLEEARGSLKNLQEFSCDWF